jgi:hypothetical protein
VVRLTICFAFASSLLSAAQHINAAASSAAARSQSQAPAADAGATPAQAPSANQNGQEAGDDSQAAGKSNNRILFALPNFLTVEKGVKVPPLSAKQKFAIMARSSFDYSQIPRYAVIAAISQAENSEPAFGQGAEGYGKRFAITFADGTIENFMTIALMPSLLHQDPRYYRLGEGSFAHRTGYVLTRVFATRGDSGRPQFNASGILGSALAAGISTFSYHPRSTYVSTPTNPRLYISSDRTFKNAASEWGTLIGFDTLTIAAREFWPDIQRKIWHKHKSEDGSSSLK